VLGLSKYRYKATEDQIKRAHRKKVLKHHPDKKAAAGSTDDDSFFKCIQKATEILLDPVKRRQWDSVDEGANVSPPSKKDVQKKGFFKTWGPVFESEGRFSKVTPVPQLGDDSSTKEEVENFYNFWYSFDSWRSFEYLDEDVPDDNENRDQKRHVERKNNNARKKRKTEDTARLRKLVDDALNQDERIKRFQKEERAQKNKKRNEREAEAKRLAEEAAKAKEEEARLQAERDAAEKAEKADAKKAKEAAKNAAKKNKRVVRGSVKDANYFHAQGDAPAAQIDAVLSDVDLILTRIDNEELAALTSKLNNNKDAASVRAIFEEETKRLMEGGKVKANEVRCFGQ
jgi:DnaJ homolog subfamily C member 2